MTEATKDTWLEGIVHRNDTDLKRYLSQRIGNRAEAEDLCRRFLTNPVIEDSVVELQAGAGVGR